VVLGCRASHDLRALIAGLLSERIALGLPPFKVFEAVQDLRRYRLAIHQCSIADQTTSVQEEVAQ
jgi:hypothetical protein